MSLREDFKDDVLDTSVNTNRTFNILSKTGTVLQTDVRIEETTAFEQEGDDFGAAEINATNKEINRVAKNTCTNLINVFAEDMSASGVQLTSNYDGTYELSGTASADVYFDITDSRTPIETYWPKLKAGKYRIVRDSPSNGVTLYMQETNTEGTLKTGVFEVANDNTPYRVRLKIDSGTVLNGLTVKPMLTSNLSATYDDFIQYSGNGEVNENLVSLYKNKQDTASKFLNTSNKTIIGAINEHEADITQINSDLTKLNSNLTINTEKTISLTTSQYESIEPTNNFTPNKSGLYRIKLYYHNDEPLELRVGTSSNYRNSEYIVNQPSGNLGSLNLICFLDSGVTYSIGTKYANGGAVDNNAGFIQRLITIS